MNKTIFYNIKIQPFNTSSYRFLSLEFKIDILERVFPFQIARENEMNQDEDLRQQQTVSDAKQLQ
jgi:hypothetical protein